MADPKQPFDVDSETLDTIDVYRKLERFGDKEAGYIMTEVQTRNAMKPENLARLKTGTPVGPMNVADLLVSPVRLAGVKQAGADELAKLIAEKYNTALEAQQPKKQTGGFGPGFREELAGITKLYTNVKCNPDDDDCMKGSVNLAVDDVKALNILAKKAIRRNKKLTNTTYDIYKENFVDFTHNYVLPRMRYIQELQMLGELVQTMPTEPEWSHELGSALRRSSAVTGRDLDAANVRLVQEILANEAMDANVMSKSELANMLRDKGFDETLAMSTANEYLTLAKASGPGVGAAPVVGGKRRRRKKSKRKSKKSKRSKTKSRSKSKSKSRSRKRKTKRRSKSKSRSRRRRRK